MKLTEAGRKVLLAVISQTALYSKTADDTYAADIAAEAGVHERTALRWLKVMDAEGVITWTPRRGREKLSTVSLLPREKPGDSDPVLEPPGAKKTGPKTGRKTGRQKLVNRREPERTELQREGAYAEVGINASRARAHEAEGSLFAEDGSVAARLRDRHERGLA